MKKQISINDLRVILIDSGEAPAWCENGVIYIREGASEDEQRVLLRHELGHLLLRHVAKATANKWDPQLANTAGDAEIALALYDDLDEAIINLPRSVLKGGITKEWAHKHAPGANTFEEIYEMLKQNQTPAPATHCIHAEMHANDEDKNNIEVDAEGISDEDLRQVIKKLESSISKQQQHHKLCQAPTLARQKGFKDIVADIAREAIMRESTFRRPSRRSSDPSLLKKGVRTKKTRPRVTVYVDRSGSFTPDKTAEAEKQILEIAYRYRAKLNIDFLYFSDKISDVSDNIAGGGTNYRAVANHIIKHQPRMAVVITDDDGCETLPPIPKSVQVCARLIDCTSAPFAAAAGAIIV